MCISTFVFWSTCIALWIAEIILWINALEANEPKKYAQTIAATFVFSAIMHYLGIETTICNFHQSKVMWLIKLGVPGFDMFQLTAIFLAYLIFMLRKDH